LFKFKTGAFTEAAECDRLLSRVLVIKPLLSALLCDLFDVVLVLEECMDRVTPPPRAVKIEPAEMIKRSKLSYPSILHTEIEIDIRTRMKIAVNVVFI